MGQKHEYMIWREKNGFFTALDRRSNLLTWSMVTGKLLYSEQQHGEGEEGKMAEYEVFRADERDITYTQDFYNQAESSLSLLKSKKPVGVQLEDGVGEIKVS